jgi:hypothetical protein
MGEHAEDALLWELSQRCEYSAPFPLRLSKEDAIRVHRKESKKARKKLCRTLCQRAPLTPEPPPRVWRCVLSFLGGK